jgi:MiaB-like tRNA modifying enzyme
MKIHFETYGCTMNQGDTEIMMGLVEGKYEVVDSADNCDIAIINSCGVMQFTERKILRRIEELKGLNKKVMVAGCLPNINFKALEKSKADGIISARALDRVSDAIQKISNDERFIDVSDRNIQKSCILKKRKAGVIAIVPISEGCLSTCSYCATRFARGRLRSSPLDSIVKEVEDAITKGFKEIQLTAQDTGMYGLDTGKRLPELLTKICEIPADFRVRVGMMNPEFAFNILDDLIDSFSDEKVYKFVHIPVQSGDNEVLEHMRRGYDVQGFVELVNTFRKGIKDITLSTDVIVGYPTENEDSFLKTYQLVEKIGPDILNIKRFSPRPRTAAGKLKDMPDRIKKERSRKLTALHKKIGLEKNKRYMNQELEVLVTELGKNQTLLGRTNSYKQVVLENGKLGEFKKIKIREATPSYLIAQ